MSDFVQKPLNKRMNRQNPVSRIERVERAVGPGPSASVESLSDLSTESGIIRGDLILAPASGVETEEVTSTDYTGVFMSGDGKTFNGEDWNFGGVNTGVFEAGFSALTGKLTAGAGAVVLDADGVNITAGATITDPTTIKYFDTSGNKVAFLGAFGSVSNNFNFIVDEVAGKLTTLEIETHAPTEETSTIELNAICNTVQAIIIVRAIDNAQSEIIINQAGHDVDTHILDDNGDSIASFDAGLKALVARRHMVLEATGAVISSDTITITSPNVTLDTEAAAAADNLATINGGVQAGQLLILRITNSTRDVTVKDATGNIQLSGGDRLLSNVKDRLFLQWDGADWCELSFSDNV